MSAQGSFVLKMSVLPEPNPGPSFGVLSTSTSLEPNQTNPPSTGLATLQQVYVFPEPCRLGTFRAFGSASLLGTFNQREDPTLLDLYVDGERVRNLVSIAPGLEDFDLTDPGGDEFAAGALVQFVIPIGGESFGTINGVLFAFSVGPQ